MPAPALSPLMEFIMARSREELAGIGPMTGQRVQREERVRRTLLKKHLGAHRCEGGGLYGDLRAPRKWWDCPEVRVIGYTWADHPDYQEHWTPSDDGDFAATHRITDEVQPRG